ncbi:RNA methyltransferase [Bifidobacterium margollesii]|uniref:RNA methyltransferase n=1 Tax=Bifidobacterium margollesii TaxID=2020964 RepID=A0A2N5J8I7_9BIFI|nr:TRAM domain-containing protein [Bifidobacterium margollesii]PLS30505.1 RNA methyltransferase [Bifidobacterium margollesii]
MTAHQVRIERYADQGRCVAHIDGRVVFVRFALPGELVAIELDEPHDRDDRFWTGEVTEVIESSEDRVEPAWPLAGPLAFGGGVGGADLIHVSVSGQRAWKSATVSEQMRRLGHVDVEVPVSGVPGDEERHGLGWRTRIEMIADDEGRPSMRRRGTHVRVPLDSMPLATDTLNDLAGREHVWEGGFESGAQIRIAVPQPRTTAGGSGKSDDSVDDYAVLVGGELRSGSRLLTEHVVINDEAGSPHDFVYTVDAAGFWQMHREAPNVLANAVTETVRRAVDGKRHAVLWDLYSGSGLFTLPLASMVADGVRVLSVEGAKEAVHNAHRNLGRAGLDNVDARTGDVAKTLRVVPKRFAHPDVVVLDPPRAGARKRVCEQIADSGARTVVYVACDPASLARDTATLTEHGYTLSRIHAHDIYPNTHHVETIALFVR